MATMACYPSFEQPQQQTRVIPTPQQQQTTQQQQQKDYSKPLHVDCSVEYELPNQARPPGKSEPLLMIHPCFYRRAESQRRSPFINNLPQTQQNAVQQTQPQPQTTTTSTRRSSTRNSTNNSNNNNSLLLQQQQQQRYATQQLRYMEQQQVAVAFQQQQQNITWNEQQQNNTSTGIYCKPTTTRTTRRNSRKNSTVKQHDNYSSSGDSGISALWTTDTSPAIGLHQHLVEQQQILDKNIINDSTQQQSTSSRRAGYSLRSESNSGDLADLLAAACGADHLPPLPKVGVAPGKNLLPSQPQSSMTSCQLGGRNCSCNLHRSSVQQPAVGVAAVASCRSCRPTTQHQSIPTQQQLYQQPPAPPALQQQQPWPAQFAHPPAAVPASACEPEPAAAASGQVRRAWSRSGGGTIPSAKRSRVSTQQANITSAVVAAAAAYPPTSSSASWGVSNNPFLDTNTSWQRQTTSCGLGSSNNNNNNNNKDCGAMCKVCCPSSVTPQQQQQQQQQQQTFPNTQEQQQWNASYYCRGASEDTVTSRSMMWNNENMLRLFQV